MSIVECDIKNKNKQLEFYQELCNILEQKLKKNDNIIDKIIQIIKEHTIVDNGLEFKLYDYDVADLLELINSLRNDKGDNNE